ncbi:MAG: hypothetical protein Mars2KO_01530 [Maribacter sp.]
MSGDIQEEGWYFVGKIYEAILEALLLGQSFVWVRFPRETIFLLAHLGASEYAKDFGHCGS